ncbi:MAG TPA: methyltransferase domain-containing protein, partial [Candidatus Omnitrophota bacterium]|nr:methyltransferase domain-containing protein [Candidatus Omnitrophota bacterium]
ERRGAGHGVSHTLARVAIARFKVSAHGDAHGSCDAGDVLEHIRDPRAFLTEIHRILKPDGILYLAMPDFSGLHYRVMRMIAYFNHKNYFVLPHHIFHFTPQTLEKLLHEAGFVKLKSLSTESSIQEEGLRRLFMLMLFAAARIFDMKDRIVMLAAKMKEAPQAQP